MKMKKFLCVIISLCFLVFAGCASGTPGKEPDDGPGIIVPEDPDPDQGRENVVRFYPVPEGVQGYDGAEVFLGDEKLPLYGVFVNTSQVWKPNGYERTLNGVGLFELDGRVTVTVKPRVKLVGESVVRPLSANVVPQIDLTENTISFTVKSAGEYVVEVNGDLYDAVHLFVSDYGAAPNTQGYGNVMVFEAGLHTSANDDRIGGDNGVYVPSNTLVWLKDGAVVRAKFNSYQQNNIAIVGRGIIDGSTFDRDANRGTVTVPIDFNYCTNVTLSDFFVLDPAGWCVNFYFINGGNITDIKIITSRSNGDGISLQSCKNIVTEGCFVRTWDDSLVVKNYPRWDTRAHGATENILFKNCTIWTDLAQCMEIGYETVGQTLKDVTFENITVMHALHNAVISIHNGNNADVQNVTYKNITVEEGEAPASAAIILIQVLYSAIWSDQHAVTGLGSVSGVNIENLKVISAKKVVNITVGGYNDTRNGYESEHFVDGVTIKGISMGSALPPVSQWRVNKNSYVKNVTLEQTDEVTGATFVSSRTEDYLSQFGNSLKVEAII